jgi:hypothetical protein
MLPRPSVSAVLGTRPYTRFVTAPDSCAICGKTVGYSLARCPLCHRSFCESCEMRRGGLVFCGAGCAHAFFYGEADEEDLPEGEVEE